jgi:hypothetical protein
MTYTNPITRPEDYVPIAAEQVNQIAKDLGIEIPPFIVEFFVQYNGAGLTNQKMIDTCVVKELFDFSNELISGRRYASVKNYFEVNRDEDDDEKRLPDYMLPFGNNLNDATLFVSLHPDELGYVYKSYWEEDDLKLIHTNFLNFINELVPFVLSGPPRS